MWQSFYLSCKVSSVGTGDLSVLPTTNPLEMDMTAPQSAHQATVARLLFQIQRDMCQAAG